ncbi:MAG: hypothetical protein ACRDU4_04130 [Mycobacterium sp.]
MDWTVPLSTLMGALVGVGSTLLVDIIRSRRDRIRQLVEVRRQVYAQFLEALTNTDGELQMLAASQPAPVDEVSIRTTWRKYSLLALRYEVELVAPESVAATANAAYKTLRDMRNAIGTAELSVGFPRSPEWEAIHRPYINAIDALRSSMRTDIQQRLEK